MARPHITDEGTKARKVQTNLAGSHPMERRCIKTSEQIIDYLELVWRQRSIPSDEAPRLTMGTPYLLTTQTGRQKCYSQVASHKLIPDEVGETGAYRR